MVFKKYYSARIGDGRVSRPTFDEARQDLRRAYLAGSLGSERDAGSDRRDLRRL
jgi:hypothetical protein